MGKLFELDKNDVKMLLSKNDCEIPLYRIIYKRDFQVNINMPPEEYNKLYNDCCIKFVSAGEKGGYVESESCVDQDSDIYISKDSIVFDSKISGNVTLINSKIEHAKIEGNCLIRNFNICSSTIKGCANIYNVKKSDRYEHEHCFIGGEIYDSSLNGTITISFDTDANNTFCLSRCTLDGNIIIDTNNGSYYIINGTIIKSKGLIYIYNSVLKGGIIIGQNYIKDSELDRCKITGSHKINKSLLYKFDSTNNSTDINILDKLNIDNR